MPKLRIKRLYYRNGQIHMEQRELGTKLHGHSRTWHHNGQLAEDHPYRHGVLHGTCRQWDENGRLLGSFAMNHGTGRQFYWHQNGKPRLEINSLKGKFYGRTRIWMRDGTLVQESYYISNVDVPRAKYLKAARHHPDWPQHDGEPAGKVARDSRSLKRKEHELFIQSLLEKSCAEARQWLSVQNPDLRSLSGFRTAKAALQTVENLYVAGAKAVVIALIYRSKHGKQFADRLLIKLPKVSAKRKILRKMCQDLCASLGGALLPDKKDIGESHLFVSFE
jgi:hypothetical protein